MAQLTAVLYNADNMFAVHAAGCPDIKDLQWPVIRGRVHLTARSKARAVDLIWGNWLVPAHRGVTDRAKFVRFAACCGPLPDREDS